MLGEHIGSLADLLPGIGCETKSKLQEIEITLVRWVKIAGAALSKIIHC
jgi:hypothetical protein